MNGDDKRENDSARNQYEEMGGPEGGNNDDTERHYKGHGRGIQNDDAYINITLSDSSCVKILTWNIEGLQKYTDDVELKKIFTNL